MPRDRREQTGSRRTGMLPPLPRTCSQLPVPGHEITALSLWKRPPSPANLHRPTPCHLARLLPAACAAYANSARVYDPRPLPRRAPFVREPPKIMLPEISIKRDSVRAGIRLNLSSYSPRERKETFRAWGMACPGFEMTRDLPCSLVTLALLPLLLSPLFLSFSLSF